MTEVDMAGQVRFGYKASAEQFGPAQLADYAVLAEQAGFDSVFISDHFQPWRHDGGHAPAAIPWLGAVGARTERIILGTSVLTPSFHRAIRLSKLPFRLNRRSVQPRPPDARSAAR